jgi:hypothetical protein
MAPNGQYDRDPHYPTSRDLAVDLDRLADLWVFDRLGSDDLDPDTWPRPGDGRLHNQLSFEATRARGEHGTPVDFLERPPLPEPPKDPLCSNCGLAPPEVNKTGLCGRCRKAVERTGKPPTRRSNWFHRRRVDTVHR